MLETQYEVTYRHGSKGYQKIEQQYNLICHFRLSPSILLALFAQSIIKLVKFWSFCSDKFAPKCSNWSEWSNRTPDRDGGGLNSAYEVTKKTYS